MCIRTCIYARFQLEPICVKSVKRLNITFIRRDKQESATCCGKTQSALGANSNTIDFKEIRICCPLLYLYSSQYSRIKEKRFPLARSSQQLKKNRPVYLEHVCIFIPVSFRETIGQVDARDGICALRGTPAECILRVADVKRLKSPERHAYQIPRDVYSVVMMVVSPKFLRQNSSFPTHVQLILIKLLAQFLLLHEQVTKCLLGARRSRDVFFFSFFQ